MNKKKFTLEYNFKKGSLSVLWNLVSTPLGLAEWFADNVLVSDNIYSFIWEKNTETAVVIQTKQNSFIRMQWEEDANTDYFFEMRIESQPITGDIGLLVTDFAEDNEIEDAKLLWDHQIENLRRKTGL